jgi:uncharacterized protein (DUF2062 family)
MRRLAYFLHRLRRLADPPHRIARGVFAGIFVSFSPFIGFHVPLAAAIAWLLRGNMLAAVLATVIGNPLTFPIIGWAALEVGYAILGNDLRIDGAGALKAIAFAIGQLRSNIAAAFGGGEARWEGLAAVARKVVMPYAVGGAVVGTAAGAIGYALLLPVARRQQSRRAARRTPRDERGESAARRPASRRAARRRDG